MKEVLELASNLGKAISRPDREASALYEKFQKERERILNLERELKPIEASEKRNLAELQDKVKKDVKLQSLMRAEADYLEMMYKVQKRIYGELELNREES